MKTSPEKSPEKNCIAQMCSFQIAQETDKETAQNQSRIKPKLANSMQTKAQAKCDTLLIESKLISNYCNFYIMPINVFKYIK